MDGYIHCESEITSTQFHNDIARHLQKNRLYGDKFTLLFISDDGKEDISKEEENIVVLYRTKTRNDFASDYFDQLKTLELGHVLIYMKNITSTMDLVHLLRPIVSTRMLAIAERQTSGRGRSNTKWESPLGCAMFTFNLEYDLDSPLGQYPAFLGYLTASSIVRAVQDLTEGVIQLRIKWPNDIFAPDCSTKIGGTLHDVIQNGSGAVIGVGFNVANEKPTVCLNALIDEWNMNNGQKTRQPITIQQFVSCFMNHFERFFKLFQNGKREELLNVYLATWLHQNQTFSNQIDENINPYDVIIRGLDKKGCLFCEKVLDQSEESISPHGLSMDVVKQIIHKKISPPS
ncbi:biotin--protein ligase-like [Clytia hemisphaerica]|uniref:BPL/LPL catalytic domain-containing protein n=1 Tax=Clytia hemisphaerica TaxID=252671 RepID=A0A7M5WYA1_9CNID